MSPINSVAQPVFLTLLEDVADPEYPEVYSFDLEAFRPQVSRPARNPETIKGLKAEELSTGQPDFSNGETSAGQRNNLFSGNCHPSRQDMAPALPSLLSECLPIIDLISA
jgi:hypothetical protein